MNIDRDDEYATRYEMTEPTIDEQIKHQKELCDMHGSNPAMRRSILASLEKLAALESQPVPVEPECIRNEKWIVKGRLYAAIEHIDSLQSALKLAQVLIGQQNECAIYYQERFNERTTQYVAERERAEKAEAERDLARATRNEATDAMKKAESLNRRMVELMKEPSDAVLNHFAGTEFRRLSPSKQAAEICDFKAMSAELLKEVEK